jgi:uncharacterized protein (DUF488 family)
MASSALVSLGYENRTVDELIANLLAESVTVLVDVRLTPLSRKPGMSKRRLAATLDAVGIRYVHLRALGNPKDNRAPFRAGDPRSHELFRAILRDDQGATAISHVAELLDGERVALLCFEREHDACHRRLVVEELQRANPAVELVAI